MLAIIAASIVIILIILVSIYFLNKLSGNSLPEQPEEQSQPRSRPIHADSRSYDSDQRLNQSNTELINTNTTQAQENALTSNRNLEIKPLTKKDIKKQEKKKLKGDNREYQKQILEEKRLRDQERDREYREKEIQREELRRKNEEILKQLQEQKEKTENEIYDKWKDQFKIEDEGVEVSALDTEDMINDFINYIKIRKVVALEDLSGVFKIPPNEIVEKLKYFEEQNKICGIIDDRGKYIYLTEKEIASIEKIFMQRGRISKMELLKECNKIIRFVPSEEDKLKIIEEQKKIWKTFEEEELTDKNNLNNANVKK